jgi:CheY-like chemotaxis protein
VNLLILVVDDEPDVEVLFRQQFRRDLRTDRFTMEFAQSAHMALQRTSQDVNQCRTGGLGIDRLEPMRRIADGAQHLVLINKFEGRGHGARSGHDAP